MREQLQRSKPERSDHWRHCSACSFDGHTPASANHRCGSCSSWRGGCGRWSDGESGLSKDKALPGECLATLLSLNCVIHYVQSLFIPRDQVGETPGVEFAADSLGRPAAGPSVQGVVEKCEQLEYITVLVTLVLVCQSSISRLGFSHLVAAIF